MRVTSFAAALCLFAVAEPGNAALMMSLDGVVAGGTQRTDYVDPACTRTATCQTVTSPYSVIIGGMVNTLPDNLGGMVTVSGQNGARSFYDVTLQFDSAGNLLSTGLTGFAELQRCTSLPCTNRVANFSASNFAVTVTDQATGVSRILAPIPEPATWALLLLGFAGAGTALRITRRRKHGLACVSA